MIPNAGILKVIVALLVIGACIAIIGCANSYPAPCDSVYEYAVATRDGWLPCSETEMNKD